MGGEWRFDSLPRLRAAAASIGDSSSDDALAKDLKYVEKTWVRIKAALADAEEREIREEPVRQWLRELRDLAYDAGDLLDIHDYQSVAAQVEPRTPPAPSSGDEEEMDLARGVERIRRRFEEIAEKKKALRLRNSKDPPESHPEPPSSPLPAIPEILVGRDDSAQDLLGALLSDGGGEAAEVVAVVGMGGVGKTALCRHLYRNDREISARFDLKAWIRVGEALDVARLTEEIAGSFAADGDGTSDLSELQMSIADAVRGKTILLVLDDVWTRNVRDWDTVRAPLCHGVGEGSKILITARSEDIAGTTGATRLIKLDCLSKETGQLLFSHHAFGSSRRFPSGELESVGEAIVEKCGGLPLAIKVIGSLLRSKGDDPKSWRDVLNSDLWDLDVYGREGRSKILGSLYLSYLHLPAHLKACFRLCQVFKGETIRERDLVGLWTAHDLIGDEGETTLEGMARRNIEELVSKSFFDREFVQEDFDQEDEVVVVDRAHLANTELITMHDLIEDVAG